MKSIFEAKNALKCVCKDFEVIGTDNKAKTAKNFLKQLRTRQEELGLTYDQCRDAALKIKHGDFEGGLKTIWKSKVKINTEKSEDGYTVTKEYDVNGYATFIEKINRMGGAYVYTLQAAYDSNPEPSASLRYIIDIQIRPNSGDMDVLEERALKNAFLNLNASRIYNFLFVCYDDYDLTSSLNRFHLKLKNKFNSK